MSFRDLFLFRFSFVELRDFVCLWLNKAAQEAKNFSNKKRHIVLILSLGIPVLYVAME